MFILWFRILNVDSSPHEDSWGLYKEHILLTHSNHYQNLQSQNKNNSLARMTDLPSSGCCLAPIKSPGTNTINEPQCDPKISCSESGTLVAEPNVGFSMFLSMVDFFQEYYSGRTWISTPRPTRPALTQAGARERRPGFH